MFISLRTSWFATLVVLSMTPTIGFGINYDFAAINAVPANFDIGPLPSSRLAIVGSADDQALSFNLNNYQHDFAGRSDKPFIQITSGVTVDTSQRLFLRVEYRCEPNTSFTNSSTIIEAFIRAGGTNYPGENFSALGSLDVGQPGWRTATVELTELFAAVASASSDNFPVSDFRLRIGNWATSATAYNGTVLFRSIQIVGEDNIPDAASPPAAQPPPAEDGALQVAVLPRELASGFQNLALDDSGLRINGTPQPGNLNGAGSEILALSDMELKANRDYTLQVQARADEATELVVEIRRAHAMDGDGLLYTTSTTVGPDLTTITGAFGSEQHFGNDLEVRFHVGALPPGQSFEVTSISLQEQTGGDPTWIRQGYRLSLTSDANGQILLLPYYFPLTVHFGGGPTDTFSNQKLQEFVNDFNATLLPITDSSPVIVDTNDLRNGGYEAYLVSSDGTVLESRSFHIAFDRLRYSPDYRVTVADALGRTYRVDTFESRREPYYIQGGVQGGTNFSRTDFNASSNRQPVMAQSFANISTDAYPIQITVEVLEHATLPFFDGAPGMTLPLEDVRVLPSSKNVEATLLNGNTFTFTLESAEKVMVFPNHDKVMDVIQLRADRVNDYLFQSFEEEIAGLGNNTPWGFILDDIREGFKNPLIILARGPNPIPCELKDDSATLVVRSGDRPTQAQLDSHDVVWFEGGTHDFSRLGSFPTHRTYIRPGQRWYFEENAFVAAGINDANREGTIGPDGELSANASALIGRGTITGINHFWGAGGYDVNSAIAEVTKVQGMNVTDRAAWGVEGGGLLEDIALVGAWHGNNDGLDGLKGTTVRDVLLISHDDNLKVHDGTTAEKVIAFMNGTNGHPIMFKEFHRDFHGTGQLILNEPIPMRNIRVSDVDILGYWRVARNNQNGWFRISPGGIASIQSFPTVIENVLFSGIRMEMPYLHRVFGFYNAYADESLLDNYLNTQNLNAAQRRTVKEDLTYMPSWLMQTFGSGLEPQIRNVTFENITVNTPMISHRSLLGTAFEDTIDGFRFTNITINGVTLTENNFHEHFEVTGYRNGTGMGDRPLGFHLENANYGSPGGVRVEVPLPDTLYEVFLTYFEAWAADRGFTGGPLGDDSGNGVKNLAELAFGPSAFSSSAWPGLLHVSDSGRDVTLRFMTLAKPNLPISYILEKSPHLQSGSWQTVEAPVRRPHGSVFGQYVHSELSIAMAETDMFYRVRVEQLASGGAELGVSDSNDPELKSLPKEKPE